MGEKKNTLEKRIFKASFLVLIAHVLFKLAGLIQAKTMVAYLPGEAYDALYAFAFENGIYMLFLLSEESLAPAFLPVFMRQLDSAGEREAWSFANIVFTLQAILLVVAAGVLYWSPESLVSLMSAWGSGSSPERFELAVRSIRNMAPALIGLSLGATTYAVLNSYKRFFLAAFGDAMWKFCAVAFLLAGAFLKQDCSSWLMAGLVAGGTIKLLTHLVGLRDKRQYFRLSLNLKHPAMREMLWLILPLLAGVIIAKVRDVYNNVYILSALDESGLMQANSIGRKLQSTLLFLVPYTLSIAVFPFFCELVDRQDREGLGQLLTRFGRMLLAIFVPFALFVAVAAIPLTALLFKGGYFDSVAVQRTAVSLSCYTFMLPAAAIEMLLMQAFFANRRMVSVTVIGAVFSFFSMGVSWLGLQFCGSRELILLGVIAGGMTLARTLKCITLVEMLRKNAPVFPFWETTAFMLRLVVAGGAAAGAGWLLLHWSVVADLPGLLGEVLRLGVAGAAFGVVYLAAAFALRITEINEVFVLLRNLRKKRPA